MQTDFLSLKRCCYVDFREQCEGWLTACNRALSSRLSAKTKLAGSVEAQACVNLV
jgi:hypothetical protein